MILKAFADNPETLHIELGAGCGNFGQTFFPECFLSDKSLTQQLKNCPNGSHATLEIDAYSIPCSDNRFEKVVMCNPYGYGFRDADESLGLFDELYRVTQKEGEVIIITHNRNPYANPKRVGKRLNDFNQGIAKFVTQVSHRPNFDFGRV